jgi:hypothetical protein
MVDVYKALTFLFAPPAIALLATIVFSLYSPVGLGYMSIRASIYIGCMFLVIIPSLSVVVFRRRDIQLRDRQGRNIPYTITILSYAVATILYHFVASEAMFLLSLSYVLVSSAMAIINMRTKVSAHAAGYAGPVTAFLFVFGMRSAPLYALLFFVYLSKLKLKAHTPRQLAIGTVVGIVITGLVYAYLW